MTGRRARERPPRLAAWLLASLAERSERDHLLGDLEQEFGGRVGRTGRRGPAVRWYLLQTARSIPHLLRRRLVRLRPDQAAVALDLRYALRSLRRGPSFTAVAVITLALGIGATTIAFTFVNGILLEPLPVPEPERLYQILQTQEGRTSSSWLSTPDVHDIRREARSFRRLAAVAFDRFIVQGAGDPQYVGGAEASPDYFAVLGMQPVAGRLLGSPDDEADRVVISDRLWLRTFGRDPRAVGAILELDGRPVEIVGVVPDHADVLGGTDVWVPIRTSIAGWRQSRGTDWVFAIGRLADGTTPERAQAELDQLGARLATAFPETNRGQAFTASGLHARLTQAVRSPLLVLMGAVSLVLLIVCVNLAGLLLARGLTRRREIATRIAIGGGRGRLLSQLLAESMVLAGAGGGIGVGLAVYGVRGAKLLLPPDLPRLSGLGVDATVLWFSVGICVTATLLFGLAPAWAAVRRDVGSALGGRSLGVDSGHVRARRALVVGQIALALVLLVGASLLLRSFQRLSEVDLGMRTESVVSARLPLVGAAFPTPPDWNRHYREMLRSIQDAPGVEAAAMVNALPLRDPGPAFSFQSDEPMPVPEEDRIAGYRAVLGDYFSVMGIEVHSGRTFSQDEIEGRVPAVVVDDAFQRAFFPDGAVGSSIEVVDGARPIIGVVASVPDVSPAAAARPKMYLPLTPNVRQTMTVVVTTRLGEPEATESLRSAIRSADPEQTIQSLLPMRAYRRRSVQQEQLVLVVLAGLGGLALLLAALGTYGILAYLVSQRTREIGLRIALGASRSAVRRIVLGSGAAMLAGGLILGTALAGAAARFLDGLLFETARLDPGAFVAAAALLAAAALAASALPAFRATRVSAVEALRSD